MARQPQASIDGNDWNADHSERRPICAFYRPRGNVFVIMMHAFVERDVDLESRLKAWKAAAMARVKRTWLGLRSTEPLIKLQPNADSLMARSRAQGSTSISGSSCKIWRMPICTSETWNR